MADARFDVFMADQFALVGLADTAADCGTKLGVFFEQSESGIFHEFCGIGAVMARDLRSCVSCSAVKCTSMVMARPKVIGIVFNSSK
jgi:hypothetical protein